MWLFDSLNLRQASFIKTKMKCHSTIWMEETSETLFTHGHAPATRHQVMAKLRGKVDHCFLLCVAPWCPQVKMLLVKQKTSHSHRLQTLESLAQTWAEHAHCRSYSLEAIKGLQVVNSLRGVSP